MYSNLGDVNFFEYGMLIEKENDDCYNVIYCMPYSDSEYNDDNDDIFQFGYLTVDPNDSWIDKEDIIEYAGLDSNQPDSPYYFVAACISYYGALSFGNVYDYLKRKEIQEVMNNLLKQGKIGEDVRF